jgi:uncharacterized protein with HEPN domain
MPERPAKMLLEDILDAIEGIERFIAGISEEQYYKDEKTQAAVERYLEILGEAANKLPQEIYTSSPEIEWNKVIAVRNRIIHAYFDVNDKIIWEIAVNFLPGLKAGIKKLL